MNTNLHLHTALELIESVEDDYRRKTGKTPTRIGTNRSDVSAGTPDWQVSKQIPPHLKEPVRDLVVLKRRYPDAGRGQLLRLALNDGEGTYKPKPSPQQTFSPSNATPSNAPPDPYGLQKEET